MTALVAPDPIRQSSIARFDNCALSLLLEAQQPRAKQHQPGIMAARGTMFHRWVARAIAQMRAEGWTSYPVEMGMELLLQVLAQRDVPDEEVVHLPMRELQWLRVLVTRWCEGGEFNAQRVIAVEERWYMKVPVPDGTGGTYDRTVSGMPDVVVADPPDGVIIVDWKAQPLDAKVLTPAGWREMGQLSVGDEVTGGDGGAVRVSGVYPQGVKEVFEVTLKDGSRTRCTDEHLWAVRWPGQPLKVRTLAEIRKLKSRCYVPAVAPVQFDSQGALPIEPYLLGALLGDGCLRANGSIGFTSDDEAIVSELAGLLPAGVIAKPEVHQGWSFTSAERPNALRSALRDLGLIGKRAWEKAVPQPYLTAPVEDRLAVLQGLMDTDGTIDQAGRMSFGSSSPELAQNVLWLVRSLGGRATYKVWPGHTSNFRSNHDAHSVYFRLPECPFRLARKRSRWHPPRQSFDRGIVSIVSVGEAETQCIRVAAAEGLYVTDDFIVTHNSGWAPPSKLNEEARADPMKDERLSDQGYAQQVIYGALGLVNLPAVQRVTLREAYIMHGEYREAEIHRYQLERVLDILGATLSQIDAAFEAGPDSARWLPSAGTHCGICPAPRQCPLKDWEGIPTDDDEAKLLAREWIVAAQVRKDRLPLLKGWVDQNGPIEIDHGKGRRVVGWPVWDGESKARGPFKLFEPVDAPASPFDERMEAVLRDR